MGQEVDTRVLGNPDKWDGNEKARPSWSFVMKSQVGGHDKCRDQYGCVAQRVQAELRFDHVALAELWRIANAPHGWAMEAWRMLFQAYSPKNNARLVVMMLEVLAFPSDTNDVVNSLETMERKINEFERYVNTDSRVIEDWHCDSSSRRRIDEDALHHELAQVGNFSGHQDKIDKRQGPECGEGKDGRRDGQRDSPKVLPKVPARVRTQKLCVGSARGRAIDKGQSKGSKIGRQQRTRSSRASAASVANRRSKETGAFEAGEEGLAETGCIEMAIIDLNALEIEAVQLPERDEQDSFRDRLVCCSDCVSGDGGGCSNARQNNELQAVVRQASAGSWCAKGAGQVQRGVSQVREPGSGGHAQCGGVELRRSTILPWVFTVDTWIRGQQVWVRRRGRQLHRRGR